jgi:hypothetical protein
MSPLWVFEASPTGRRMRAALVVIGLVLSAIVYVSSAVAGFQVPKSCPSASVVNKALGQSNKAPVSTKTPYGMVCTYHGRGIVPTKITFQKDTLATFAAGERAAAAAGSVVKVKGLGQAAWTTKTGGFLYVYDGGESIKILSPLTTSARLEALARKIL